MNDANVRFVMSKWRSVQDWQLWYGSEARKNMMGEMNLMLSTPEKVIFLEN
jgi:heme-degrading monooxygenase HmoA